MAALDIEDAAALLDWLRARGHIGLEEEPQCRVLAGGVSNRTVLVERSDGTAWVLKQALAQLRVKEEWFADPRRIRREALGLRWLGELAPRGATPALVFEDEAAQLLAMEAVPPPHENWKTRLLTCGPERQRVVQFGELLGTIHQRSTERRAEVEPVFADTSFFESLRIEPYYRCTAARNARAAEFFRQLIADTAATRVALVHGDYSPKNILVASGRLVLLDHEVIHWGDPAFDLGFALTHLLSKAHHLASHRVAFLAAAADFWTAYGEAPAALEARAVRHTLGCLLARVDGRSPLEYLTESERDRQRAIALDLLQSPPASLPALFRVFGARLKE
jgi:aminoglycoside phosphotransferase (APT) family kinase protein